MTNIAQWTDQETDDMILGSGALSYSWYRTIEEMKDSEGKVIGAVIGMEDPEDEDLTKEYRIKFSRMRTITREIAAGKHGIADRIIGYIKNDDLDSDAADCVLQVCAYGTAVFG